MTALLSVKFWQNYVQLVACLAFLAYAGHYLADAPHWALLLVVYLTCLSGAIVGLVIFCLHYWMVMWLNSITEGLGGLPGRLPRSDAPRAQPEAEG